VTRKLFGLTKCEVNGHLLVNKYVCRNFVIYRGGIVWTDKSGRDDGLSMQNRMWEARNA